MPAGGIGLGHTREVPAFWRGCSGADPGGAGAEGSRGSSAAMCWALSITTSPQTWLWPCWGAAQALGLSLALLLPRTLVLRPHLPRVIPMGPRELRGLADLTLAIPRQRPARCQGPRRACYVGTVGGGQHQGGHGLFPCPFDRASECTGVPSRTGGKQPCPLAGPGLALGRRSVQVPSASSVRPFLPVDITLLEFSLLGRHVIWLDFTK